MSVYTGGMDEPVHALIEQVFKNDIQSIRHTVDALDEEGLASVFKVLTGEVSVLGSAVSCIPENGSELVEFFLEKGATQALDARATNALYHRIYAMLGNRTSPEAREPALRVLDKLWSLGIGKQTSKQCWSPVHIAAALQDPELSIQHLERLQSHGFDMDVPDEVGETPLMVAAWNSGVTSVEYLLNEGASLDNRTQGGRDVVAYAFRRRLERNGEGLEDVIGILRLLHDKGYPVQEAMIKSRLASPELQAKVEAAMLQYVSGSVTQKRQGLRL